MYIPTVLVIVGGAVAPWLVHLTRELTVWLQALAGDIVLCSWASHFTLTVPLSTLVDKWVLANVMLGTTLLASHPVWRGGGVEILLVASCY